MTALPSIHDAIASIHEPTAQFIIKTGRFDLSNRPLFFYIGHMSFWDNVDVKNRMIKMGVADEKTIFVSNHFSHNGSCVTYEEFSEIAKFL